MGTWDSGQANSATGYLKAIETCGRRCHVLQESVTLAENYITFSKIIVLDCRCGEKLILLGRKEDWNREGRTDFECGGCRGKLYLEDDR